MLIASSYPNVLLVRFPATGAAAAVLVLYSCIGVNPVCAIIYPYSGDTEFAMVLVTKLDAIVKMAFPACPT
jgi:hypothetical protein